MTEKRFTVPIKYRFSHSKIQLNGEPLTNDELVRILNTNDGAFVENFALKEENEQFKEQNQRLSEQKHIYKQDWKHLCIDKELLDSENEELKERLSTWRSSCCNYINVYSILDNEVSILKETKDLDRFFEKFDKYSRMPFYEVEKSFIELQTENEQLKQRIKSRLHYYRELCNEFDKDDGFTYNIVKRIVEDLEDILK